MAEEQTNVVVEALARLAERRANKGDKEFTVRDYQDELVELCEEYRKYHEDNNQTGMLLVAGMMWSCCSLMHRASLMEQGGG